MLCAVNVMYCFVLLVEVLPCCDISTVQLCFVLVAAFAAVLHMSEAPCKQGPEPSKTAGKQQKKTQIVAMLVHPLVSKPQPH